MTPAAAALISEFEAAAKTAQQAEEALRKRLAQEARERQTLRHESPSGIRRISDRLAAANRPGA
jgi:hypothetical protein